MLDKKQFVLKAESGHGYIQRIGTSGVAVFDFWRCYDVNDAKRFTLVEAAELVIKIHELWEREFLIMYVGE